MQGIGLLRPYFGFLVYGLAGPLEFRWGVGIDQDI